jgi:excisionase family DNA binding protein
MADVLLTIEEASKQLQLSKDQIVDMVKKGLLRGFLDQKTYKFRPADIAAFKKKLASGVTTVSEVAQKRDSTTKIELTEIESEIGAEDSDQTSVLAAARSGEPQEKPPEKPVFKFGEKDLRLHEEEEGATDEGDQTSLLVPSAGAEKGKPAAKPGLDLPQSGLKLPPEGESADSVLVADESESSMDILEVAEESSESGSSASRIMFPDEVASGEEIEVAAEDRAPAGQKPTRKTGETASTDKVVTDILGPAPGEESSSDEVLETLEMEEAAAGRELAGLEAGMPPEPAAPAPVADEHETTAVPAADETKVADETKAAVGEEEAAGEPAETVGVEGAVAAALEEQVGAEQPEAPAAAEEEEEAAIIPTSWETGQPWPIGNGLLIAATIVLVIAGVLLFCEAFNIHNSFTAAVANTVVGRAR